MAGLLDIFGTSGADTLGLLGMSPKDIQSARDDAQAQALYGLAGRLFQGGNTGASIAQGLQQGQQMYKQAMQGQLQDQMQNLQLQELLKKRKQEEEMLAKQAMIDRAVAGAYRPAVAAAEPPTPTGPLSGAAFGEVGTPAQPARFDFQSLAPALMASPQGRKTLSELAASQKALQGETFKLGEGEKQYQRDPMTGEIKEVAAGSAKSKPLKEVDLGNVVVMLDSDGREVMRFPKGRAPEGPTTLQHVETENGIATFNPKTGALTPIVQDGKPVMGKGAGNLTESQGAATTYGMRMNQANEILKPLENSGLKDTGKIRSGVSGTLGAVPLIGEALSRGSDNIFNTLPTILGGLNEDQQKTIQARVNFITALLRKESGASISPTEFATAEKNYFPAPGDSEKIVKQKQDARELAIKGMKLQAGPGGKYIVQSNVTSSGW